MPTPNLSPDDEVNASARRLTSRARSQPGDGAAWHRSALIAFEQGKRDVAIHYSRRAIECSSPLPDWWNTHGTCCAALGLTREAEHGYLQAIELDPNGFAAQFNLGMLYLGQRRFAESLDRFQKTMALDSASVEAAFGAGSALRELGRHDEAVQTYQQAVGILTRSGTGAEIVRRYLAEAERSPRIAEIRYRLALAYLAQQNIPAALEQFEQAASLAPDDALIANDWGCVWWRLGKREEAANCFQTATVAAPQFAIAHTNLGCVLRSQEKVGDAIDHYRRSIAINDRLPETHNNLGCALRHQGKIDDALAAFDRALEIKPDYVEALCNVAAASLDRSEHSRAIREYQSALRLRPHSAEIHFHLGTACHRSGAFDQASQHYDAALTIEADHAQCHFHRALLKLTQGEFATGWPEYEWRLRIPESQLRFTGAPQWNGEPLNGRLLVRAEQGLGDTIQFVRYVRLLKSLTKSVTIAVPSSLLPIFRESGIGDIVDQDQRLPAADAEVAMLSLPKLLHTRLETIPHDVPYLQPREALLEAWRAELSPVNEFRVGIAWQGNSSFRGDRQRSIPLEFFEALARIEGVSLINLQIGIGREQLNSTTWRDRFWQPNRSIDERHGAFMDTAAIIKCCHLIVTSDSAVAHLAGALAAPVCVAIPYVADWRWLLRRDDCPWYPTMRLFRQTRHGDWGAVFSQIAQYVEERVARRRLILGLDAPHKTIKAIGSGAKRTTPNDIGDASPLASIHNSTDELIAGASTDSNVEQLVLSARTAFSEKRYDDCVRAFRDAIAAEPHRAELHRALAAALRATNQLSEAAHCLEQSLALEPDDWAGQNDLGCIYAKLVRLDAARACFEQALAIKPNYLDALNNLGCIHRSLGNLREAERRLRQVISSAPQSAESWNNLANVLQDQDRLLESMQAHRRAVALSPRHAEAWNGLGASLQRLGLWENSIEAFTQALAFDSGHVEARYSRALVYLALGQFDAGWNDYESRMASRRYARRRMARPVWDGSPLNGRSLLVHTEQGLGDTLHFVRFVIALQRLHAGVILECQPSLMPLLTESGVCNLVARGDALPDYELEVPLMSLPRLLNVRLDSIPMSDGYLQASPGLVAHWSRELQSLTGFKVGINWQGSPTFRDDRLRSIPLIEFAPLSAINGVALISLQQKHGLDQLRMHGKALGVRSFGRHFDREAGPFMDTAAVMRNLDLVITSDTALAHLAGALGVKVWTILGAESEWRWLVDREDSPWYASMRLFRQHRPGDWSQVFRRVAHELRQLVSSGQIQHASASLQLSQLEFYERRVTSQNGEDGVLATIFSTIGTTNRYFVEFGCGNGAQCNTALLQRQGWSGLLMDCQLQAEHKSPPIHTEHVTAENVNALFAKHNVPHDFDLLSIDVDGNDYWIWRALEWRPRVVVIEYNASAGPSVRSCIHYEPDFRWNGTDYFGASLRALAELGTEKGYALIHCETAGVNAFFVRCDCLPAGFAPASLSAIYRPPNYFYRGLRHPPDPNRQLTDPTPHKPDHSRHSE